MLAEGKGCKVALTTLNTGRLTLPAACVGMAQTLPRRSCKKWANERVQWGAPIGKHAAIADKIARMAANTFAMESMTLLHVEPRRLATRQPTSALEAAMCKMWGTREGLADRRRHHANPRRARLRNRGFAEGAR